MEIQQLQVTIEREIQAKQEAEQKIKQLEAEITCHIEFVFILHFKFLCLFRIIFQIVK